MSRFGMRCGGRGEPGEKVWQQWRIAPRSDIGSNSDNSNSDSSNSDTDNSSNDSDNSSNDNGSDSDAGDRRDKLKFSASSFKDNQNNSCPETGEPSQSWDKEPLF